MASTASVVYTVPGDKTKRYRKVYLDNHDGKRGRDLALHLYELAEGSIRSESPDARISKITLLMEENK